MKKVNLPKAVLSKLTLAEKKKLTSLTQKKQELGKQMLHYQSAYTQAARKNPKAPTLPALADKGFEYMMKAYDANQDLTKYMDMLVRKYKY